MASSLGVMPSLLAVSWLRKFSVASLSMRAVSAAILSQFTSWTLTFSFLPLIAIPSISYPLYDYLHLGPEAWPCGSHMTQSPMTDWLGPLAGLDPCYMIFFSCAWPSPIWVIIIFSHFLCLSTSFFCYLTKPSMLFLFSSFWFHSTYTVLLISICFSWHSWHCGLLGI